MDSINPHVTRAERIAIGTAVAQELFDTYPVIESVYIFGSTVRGDNLPISDVDMHYVVPRGAAPLPLKKATRNGVFIDIEADAKEDLTVEAVLGDAYVFGLINDCIVLCNCLAGQPAHPANLGPCCQPRHVLSSSFSPPSCRANVR